MKKYTFKDEKKVEPVKCPHCGAMIKELLCITNRDNRGIVSLEPTQNAKVFLHCGITNYYLELEDKQWEPPRYECPECQETITEGSGEAVVFLKTGILYDDVNDIDEIEKTISAQEK